MFESRHSSLMSLRFERSRRAPHADAAPWFRSILTSALVAAAAVGCSSSDDAPAPSSSTSPGAGLPAVNQTPSSPPAQVPPPVASNNMPSATEMLTPSLPPAQTPEDNTSEPPVEPPPTPPVNPVTGRVATPVLHNFDEAPGTANPDDPAIWIDPNASGNAFLIGTLKDAGLQVYATDGTLLQTLSPPNRPLVTAADPSTPMGVGEASAPCAGSTTGEDFGSFNNVDVEYAFPLTGADGVTRNVDIAVVSDRGCDSLRIYQIVPTRAGGPLVDITATDVPRLFPTRFEQPSPVQSPGVLAAEVDNPLEDEDTAYGLTTFRLAEAEAVNAIVSQNNRGVLGQFELQDAGNGRVTYERVREFRFSPVFTVQAAGEEPVSWTPCREEAAEDLQFEGLVVDEELGMLYAAQEIIGIWQVELDEDLPEVVVVPETQLFEKTLSFGAPFWAVPAEDEFACESEAPAPLTPETIIGPGVAGVGGANLEADAEGLAIYDLGGGEGYLIASSQGDDTFQVYDREDVTEHLGTFSVVGAGHTDGHEVTSLPFGSQFPQGAFILQNGLAAPPADTADVNGFPYDGSGGFIIVGWEDIAETLQLDIADPDDVLGD